MSVKLTKEFIDVSSITSTHSVFKLTIQKFSVTITIFRKSPRTLNVTGLKNFSQIKLFIREFQPFYLSHRVDTIFYIQKKSRRSNLFYLENHLRNNFSDLYRIEYHPEIFSGIFLKPKNKTYPTVIIHTNSYIMLSRRTIYYIIPIKKKLDLLLGI